MDVHPHWPRHASPSLKHGRQHRALRCGTCLLCAFPGSHGRRRGGYGIATGGSSDYGRADYEGDGGIGTGRGASGKVEGEGVYAGRVYDRGSDGARRGNDEGNAREGDQEGNRCGESVGERDRGSQWGVSTIDTQCEL